MEIIVEGKGKLSFAPNEIVISFNFTIKEQTYEKVLAKGTSAVNNLFNMLKQLGYEQNSIKTQSFRISEEQIYDDKQRVYLPNGYSYNQNLNLKLDLNMQKLAEIIEKISNLTIPPTYSIHFGVKEDEQIKQNIIDLAYKDALFYAQSIAEASNTKIKECSKISFVPFNEPFISATRFDASPKLARAMSVQNDIVNTIVPEDITVEKTIYCIFKAE